MNALIERNNKAHNIAKNQFSEKMSRIHPNIIHGEYVKSSIKINCECKICGYKWMSRPDNLLRKGNPRGCPKCANNIKYSESDIKLMLNKKYPNILILSNEIKWKENIFYSFVGDENIYYNRPQGLLRDNFKEFTKYRNTDTYKKELSIANPNIFCIDEYLGQSIKIKHYCKIHKHEFMIDPNHALRGQGCSGCKGKKIGDSKRLDTDEYQTRLNKVNSDILLIGEYKSRNKPTEHLCLVCGHIWNPYPNNLLRGEGCPICSPISKGESKIAHILDDNNICYEKQYRFQDCRNINPLPFDFAIFYPSSKKLAFLIEYQGRQHYRPSQFGNMTKEEAIVEFEKLKFRDAIKKDYCLKNNIDLLEIKYTQYDKIDNILLDKFNSININDYVA